jgi:Ca-activated chloride channel family protein
VSFASPAFLAALAIVPLALLAHSLSRRRARRYAVRYPGVATLAPLIPRVSSWRRIVPLTLFLASLAMLALALARPHATVAVPKEQASIVLVTDVSRSMLAEDVDPSRLEAARAAAQTFLEELPEEARVGAVAFSTDPHTVEAPTDDRGEIEDLIDALSADGGTAAGDALAAAIGLVDDGPEEERPPSAIVLLSDGETTTGRDPLPVARQAGRLGIPIHTVALGTRTATITTPDGSLIPVPPDPEAMRRIAELSGGRAFEVDDADELSGLYEELGSRVATEEEQREITGAFAAGGIVLLLAAAALGTRATARLP